MGQAKQRGSREDRIAEAVDRYARLKPPTIVCSGCQAAMTDADPMDVRQLKGIELAFCAHCEACDLDTWAVRGEPAAVRAFYTALEKASGEAVQLGLSKKRLDD